MKCSKHQTEPTRCFCLTFLSSFCSPLLPRESAAIHTVESRVRGLS